MMVLRNSFAAMAAVSVMFGATLTQAEQKAESGMDNMVSDNKIIELEKGHTVILISEKGIETTDDPSGATNMTNNDCIGMFESFPDNTYKGNGYCIETDKDGDKVFNRWTASSDMKESRYEIVGGTGKFEGVNGGGTAVDTEISGGPQGRTVTRWKGTAEYPKLHKQ